jgi:hypothetical protein
MVAEFNIADWFSKSDPVQVLLWIAYGFIVLASAAVGGFGTGYLSRLIATPIVGDLSRKVMTRIRLASGGATGLLAVLMLNPHIIGFGSGAGQGGPQPGDGKMAAADTSLGDPKTPIKNDPGSLTEKTGGKNVLRILVLSDKTTPAYQPVNRFFAFPDDPTPEPLDVPGVMKRIDELKKTGLAEVEFVQTLEGTSPQNLEVQKLRQAIHQAGLKLYERPIPK